MFTSSFFVLAAVSAFSFVSATPIDARQAAQCSPNFEGAGLRVVDSRNNQLGVSSAQALAALGSTSFRGLNAVDWHFQQVGQPIVGYIIKDVANNNLAITARTDGTVQLDKASDSGNAANQIWGVSCKWCATGISGQKSTQVASSCTITSPYAGGCLSIGPDSTSIASIGSGSCSSFNFYTGN